MSVRQMGRPARAAAVVGAVVAAGAATLMVLASGTAAAAPEVTVPGKCVDNVNVRAEPDRSSQIVAVCERGQTVKVGETRDGFVHLVDLNGWSAQQYVSVNGRTPVTPTATRAATPTRTPGPDTGTDAGSTETTGSAGPTPDPEADGGYDQPTPTHRPGLGGLLS